MIDALARTLVVLTALYFCVLAMVAWLAPSKANHFLLGFAGSSRIHYLELSIRLLVGAAFVIHAPRMFASNVFNLFGWVLMITTVGLLLLPWRWHHRFAREVVPRAIPYIKAIGIGSLALGGVILASIIRGNAS